MNNQLLGIRAFAASPALVARMGRPVAPSTVTRWGQDGKIVLVGAGRAAKVDVAASLARLDQLGVGKIRDDVAQRHAQEARQGAQTGSAIPDYQPSKKNQPNRNSGATGDATDGASSEDDLTAGRSAFVAISKHYENLLIRLEFQVSCGWRYSRSSVKEEAYGIGNTQRALVERINDQTAPRLAVMDVGRAQLLMGEVKSAKRMMNIEHAAMLRRLRRESRMRRSSFGFDDIELSDPLQRLADDLRGGKSPSTYMETLADIQSDGAYLRARKVIQEYDAALADTLTHDAVLAAGQAARRVILDALDAMVDDLLAAIEDEHDETRVHYRMTDATHDWLNQLAQRCQAVSAACPEYGARIAAGMSPRRLLTVSQWADRHRKLTTGTNLPGPWQTGQTPYLREIMDSLSEHSPVGRVVFLKSVQVGATEVLNNWLGYIMHHLRNKDCLVVVPTKEYRNQKFNPRFQRALSESPELAELITTASRNKKNTEDVLEYGIGAKIVKAGANVSTDLRSDPFPYVACDEIDEFPAEIAGSGDPMTLIEGRQTTFSRAKTFLVSTPKVEHTSRIAAEYARSDRRRYHVPCPHCGEYQPLEWGNLKWDASKIEGQESTQEHESVVRVTAVWYECVHCHQAIDEGHKTDMLTRGRWVAARPQVSAIRGYHLNSLYAPVGLGRNWRWLAEKWLTVQANTSELQAFVNERLGEVWESRRQGSDPLQLMARAEPYPDARRGLRTIGIDVQKDRIELSVWDFGPGEEGWAIDHHIVEGDSMDPTTWEDLASLINEIRPDTGGIDSGYAADHCYALGRRFRWLFITKGIEGSANTFIEDPLKRKQRLRRRRKKGEAPYLIGNVAAMALITQRLNLQLKDGQTGAPGYLHFQRGNPTLDDEWFRQLASSAYVETKRGGKIIYEWEEKASHPRNEVFDCWKIALASARLSGKTPTAATIAAATAATPPAAAPSARAAIAPSQPGGWTFERRS